MNTKSLIDSLDRDEALHFFEGIPNANNIIVTEENKDLPDETKEKEIDPRKKPDQFLKGMDEPDFQINDLLEEAFPDREIVDKVDLLVKKEVPEEDEEVEVPDDKTVTNDSSFTSLIKDGILSPFEDSEEIKDIDELKELIQANVTTKYEQGRQEGALELLGALPQDLQKAIKYALDGGKDVSGLFAKMNTQKDVQTLDIENERDQEEIIRKVLKSQDLSEEEIQEEIESYKDLNSLKRMATKLKPRLDKIQEKEIESELKRAESLREAAKEQAELYATSVKEALSTGDVYGYKLDDTLKDKLAQQMSNAMFKSVSGQNTNLLGKLLEKYQIEEPDMNRIMGATLFLLDPQEFLKKISLENSKSMEKEVIRRIKNVDITPTVETRIINTQTDKKTTKRTNNFFRPL